jgi:competence protein ComEA
MPGVGSVPGKLGRPQSRARPGWCGAGKAALVNINTADEAQLTSLKGIGPAKASYYQYRQEHGPFKTVDDLKHVWHRTRHWQRYRPFTVGP